MPFPLVKLFWVGKVLKYPFVALIETFREYRRKVRVRRADRIDRRAREESRHFFQHPLDSLRDRRFWVKCVTNGAELSLHFLALVAACRNALCRLELDSYVVWHPHHTHEHALYDAFSDRPWRDVFAGCARYLRDALRLWPESDAVPTEQRRYPVSIAAATRAEARIDVVPSQSKRVWREIIVDGGSIAVRVDECTWQAAVHIHQRPGSPMRLQLTQTGGGRVQAQLLDSNGAIVRERTLS